MKMTCAICGGRINDDGWGEFAYVASNGRDFIHHGCTPAAPAPPPPIRNTPRQPHNKASSPTSSESDFPSEFLTLPDAARLLGLSPATLRRRIKARTLPAFRLDGGQAILIERAALLRLLKPL